MSFASPANLFRSTFFRLACSFMLVFFIAMLVVLQRTDEAIEEYFEDKALGFGNELLLEKLNFLDQFGVQALSDELTLLSERSSQSREIYVLFDDACQPLAGSADRLPDTFLNANTCRRMIREGGNQLFNLPRENSGIQHQSQYGSSEVRVDDAVAVFEQLPNGGSLLVVMVAPEAEEARDFMDVTLAWTFAFLFGVGLIGATLLTRLVSLKLERINLLSREIRQGDLSQRIPLQGSGDEFDNLSANLNAMLDRIEEVLEGSKQVTNDIAHDLRTPLTRIQTRIETLKNRQIENEDFLEALTNIEAEAAALLEMFNSLLKIAGVESGRVRSSFQDVDLALVCKDVIELIEPLAEDKTVSFSPQIKDSVIVRGDKNLLFQAMVNILENAIKFTPAESNIWISLSAIEDKCILKVMDEGPGIPDDQSTKVFKRFYRLEDHRGTEGYGLGLSLVLAIAELHGGKIRLENQDLGLLFIVELPL